MTKEDTIDANYKLKLFEDYSKICLTKFVEKSKGHAQEQFSAKRA